MIRKKIIFIIILVCPFIITHAQDSSNNPNIKFDSKEEQDKSFNILDYLSSVGLSAGVTEFNGDIVGGGFMNSININNIYSIRLGKEINQIFTIRSDFMFGHLNGEKQTVSSAVYDPYSFYEGKGEEFHADFIELDLIASINIESILTQYLSYSDNNKLDFYSNVGIGMLSFKTIKSNLATHNYIYGYGYNDVLGEFENAMSFIDRPKASILGYGFSIGYEIDNNIICTFSLMHKLTNTDFIDASKMNDNNDNYRYIGFSLDWKIEDGKITTH